MPQLRFPEFINEVNNGLLKYHFEDIFLFSTGKNIKQSEASPEFETPCVRYGELYHMYKEVISEPINRTNLNKTELLFSEGDEILLPSAGEDPLDIGSASALTCKNVAIGRTINVLKPKRESVYSQIFVSYYINQQLKRKISTLAKGVSISNVYNSDLKKLKITLPPLAEQTKIADFLTSVDKRINLLQKKKAELERYKKGIMQKLFSQTIRFKDENGNDFPDWEEKKLGEIGQIITGKTPKTSDKELWNGDIQFITPTDISDGKKYQKTTVRSVVDDGKIKILPKHTIVYTCIASIGKMAITEKPAITNQQINSVIINQDNNYEFVYYSLLNMTPRIVSTQANTTLPIINKTEFSKFKIPVPTEKEQKKIANFISSIDKSIEKVGHQINESATFKKGLLQKMFV